MLFSNIDILDENITHRKGCYVGVKNQKIAYIGEQFPEEDFGEVYDGSGKLLMSGFVNTHSHSAMTLMRGYGENLVLSDWLNKRIFPFEAKLDSEAIYNGTMLAAAEMLRFGIVSTTDMYYDVAATARAVGDSGIKMNFSLGVTCFDDRDVKDVPTVRELLDALPAYHNAFDGRFKLDASIHGEYTSTPGLVEGMALLAKEKGLNMHVHLSETRAEQEACKERHGGRSPARYFYDSGVFDVPTTAAHCVWLEEADYELLSEKHVTAVNCPVSNLKLASGFCPASRLLNTGVSVALGTDGVASNNNLNLMEEIKLFAILYKGTTGDPTTITAKQALYAATQAGALAQGRGNCGALKVGNRADLIVMDLQERPYLRPCYDMVNNLVFSGMGTDVCLTMVDGKVLYRDGIYTTIDLERTVRNAEQSIEKILRQL